MHRFTVVPRLAQKIFAWREGTWASARQDSLTVLVYRSGPSSIGRRKVSLPAVSPVSSGVSARQFGKLESANRQSKEGCHARLRRIRGLLPFSHFPTMIC
jgi:hypothetical protein